MLPNVAFGCWIELRRRLAINTIVTRSAYARLLDDYSRTSEAIVARGFAVEPFAIAKERCGLP